MYINLIKLFSSSEDQNQLIIALDVESLVQVSELSHTSWVSFLDQFNPVHNVFLLLKSAVFSSISQFLCRVMLQENTSNFR